MNLDPSLAFTALLELYPAMPESQAAPLRRDLASAMSGANPPDRWAFAKAWLAERVPAGTGPRVSNESPGMAPAELERRLASPGAKFAGHYHDPSGRYDYCDDPQCCPGCRGS